MLKTIFDLAARRVIAGNVAGIMLLWWAMASTFLLGSPCLGAENLRRHIADDVAARPGAVAWSPDGRRLVFAGKGVHFYDTETGRQVDLDMREPIAVAWTAGGDVCVLYREGEETFLGVIDAEGLTEKKRLKITSDSRLLFPLEDGRTLLILASGTKVFKIGTEISYKLISLDLEKNAEKIIYTSDSIYPTTNPDTRVINAWMHAGLNPSNCSLMVIEQVKPPVGKLYSRIKGVDCRTGEARTLADTRQNGVYLSASWSPDGRRAALADKHGDLSLLENGIALPLDTPVRGLYPSWNRQGSRIYLGGSVIDSDGGNKTELFPGSPDSIASWSPDGKRIAVIAGGKLWLAEDFYPRHAPEP